GDGGLRLALWSLVAEENCRARALGCAAERGLQPFIQLLAAEFTVGGVDEINLHQPLVTAPPARFGRTDDRIGNRRWPQPIAHRGERSRDQEQQERYGQCRCHLGPFGAPCPEKAPRRPADSGPHRLERSSDATRSSRLRIQSARARASDALSDLPSSTPLLGLLLPDERR